ncbi:hypothetical protein NMG60_11024961 [Bertholletia excelsa]
MDHLHQSDRDFMVDLESGEDRREEMKTANLIVGGQSPKTLFTKVCSGFVSVDGLNKDEKGWLRSDSVLTENVNQLIEKKVDEDKDVDCVESKSGKERRKTMSAKKPPRPPRPPKALSLDAADQKLIKEIAELAMMKRARVERMKALKKMKAAKASSVTGNFVAMLFTIIFCLVIIFQGMSPGKSSTVSSQFSLQSPQVAGSGFISVHYFRNASASSITSSVSPRYVNIISLSLSQAYSLVFAVA